nr:MAG TPA: hypothetical protein [Caudoviricetes sp.]
MFELKLLNEVFKLNLQMESKTSLRVKIVRKSNLRDLSDKKVNFHRILSFHLLLLVNVKGRGI